MDRASLGRPGFEVATLYELGRRAALEPVAHEIAEQLVDSLVPTLPLGGVDGADQPFVHRVLMTAAQVGAGIGLVETTSLGTPDGQTDRRIWGVLWQALGDLPTVPVSQRFAAAYLMQAGHWIARSGVEDLDALVAVLTGDTGPVEV